MPARFIIDGDGATIRETRIEESPTRPRKRQRTDSGCNSEREGCYTPTGVVENDEEFFRSDGDCLLRVENTRFKVNAALLSDASYMLGDIIRRQHDGTERAIVLITSAAKFRALCWAIYASPEQLTPAGPDHQFVERMLQLANISQQMNCHRFSRISSAFLLRTIGSPSFGASCSSPLFAQLIDTAIQTSDDELLDTTVAVWSARIRTNDAPCVPAIIAADMHELSSLRGLAYYMHVQTMLADAGMNARGATAFQTDLSRLNNAQVTRLLSGHWSLVSLCEQLRRVPTKFICACGGTCAKTWAERWSAAARSERVGAIRAAALLSLLGTMQQMLGVDAELAAGMGKECRKAALEAFTSRARELEDGLPDHFFGWL
ncbi:hypothetical protein MKEN_00925500 [Mycena kentingensis (nom. inval.)]|nr:hypothetical protein MKEN_00925500 [Mycena kentingensis (nom. inval.)]